MSNKKQLVIFGCGGHSRSVADVALAAYSDHELIFVDEEAKEGELILGFPCVNKYPVEITKIFIAIGDNAKRRTLCEKHYTNLINIISPRAYIGREVELGRGVFVAHDAHIGVLSKISDFAVINTGAKIDHECKTGIAATMAPGAIMCGRASIGNETWIGAGALVREKVSVAPNVVVGMGAVVVKDITESGIYVGCPTRKKKGNK